MPIGENRRKMVNMVSTPLRRALTATVVGALAVGTLGVIAVVSNPDPSGDGYEPGEAAPLEGYQELPLTGENDVYAPTPRVTHGDAAWEAESETSSAGTDAPSGAPELSLPDSFVSAVMPLAPDTAYVLGVTWTGGAPAKIAARIMVGDVWGDWGHIGEEAGEGGADGGLGSGTEPFILGSGVATQVRVTTTGHPEDFTIHLISADSDPVVASFGNPHAGLGNSAPGVLPELTRVPSVVVPNPQPDVNLRSEWGAFDPVGTFNPGRVQGAGVHHTAGTNNYSAADVPGILRAIQTYHVSGRGWYDIGYNFLIDRFGQVWEGRAGGIEETWAGVHSHSFNSEVTGISVMGNYETATVPAAVENSLVALITWKFNVHGVNVNGELIHKGARFPTIFGHRDVPESSTACPGRYLYALLPTIRARVAANQAFPAYGFSQDVTGDAKHDLLILEGDTATVFEQDPDAGSTEPAPITGHIPFYGSSNVGFTMGDRWTWLIASPSLSGARGTDIMAKDRVGVLWRLAENGSGTIQSTSKFGVGWGRMRAILATGDFNGDRRNDIVAIHTASATLWFYAGNGRGGLRSGRQIGNGWSSMANASMVGDLSGDGISDLLAVTRASGDLYFYAGTGRGTFGKAQRLEAGFAGFRDIAASQDITGDGVSDVILHNPATGQTRTMIGSRSGIHAGFLDWAGGWGNWDRPIGATNWGGVPGNTFLVVDTYTGELVKPTLNRDAPIPGEVVYPGYTATSRTLTIPNLANAFIVGDAGGSAASDVVAIDIEGDAYLLLATESGFEAPVKIGVGMGAYEHVAPAGDSSLDGIPDLVAVDSSGGVWVLPMRDEGGLTLGNAMLVDNGRVGQRVYGVGSWLAGSRNDFVAIDDATGDVQILTGHGLAAVTGATTIDTGWTGLELTAAGEPAYAAAPSVVTFDRVSATFKIHVADATGAIAASNPLSVAITPGQHLGPNAVDVLPPALDFVDAAVTSVTIDGRGYGHGKGLAQYGARARADGGHTSEEILAFYYPGTTTGTAPNDAIRVWIRDADTDALRFVAEPGLSVHAGGTPVELPTDLGGAILEWRVVPTGAGLSLFYMTGSTWLPASITGLDLTAATALSITPADGAARAGYGATAGSREFPGVLTMLTDPSSATTMRLVVTLPLEEYVRSVVPREMPASWASEALKAQSVAARSYAVFDISDGGSTWYDTCSTTACQVYGGLADYRSDGSLASTNVDSRTDAATAATAGTILLYDGTVAFTQFSASNGTQTATGSQPYQVSVADPFDDYAPWSVQLDINAIEAAYPSVGTITRIRVTRDGNGPYGGRVVSLAITGESSSIDVTGNEFRFALQLKSTLFDLELSVGETTGYRSRDFNYDGFSDISLIAADGSILVYPGTTSLNFLASVGSASGLRSYSAVAAVVGFDGGTQRGLIGVAGGAIEYRAFTASATLGAPIAVAGDWTGLDLMGALDGWNGTGTTGLMVRDPSTDSLYIYPASGTGGLAARIQITDQWGFAEEIMPAGDIDHDGLADILTFDADTGVIRLHRGETGATWNATGTVVVTGLTDADAFITSGDWNVDGEFDIVYRAPSSGRTYYLLSDGAGGFEAAVLLGKGYSSYILVN